MATFSLPPEMVAEILRSRQPGTAGFDFMRQAGKSEFTREHTPPPPKREASKFDGPDVIDMVRGVDGVFAVPAQLEHRARAL